MSRVCDRGLLLRRIPFRESSLICHVLTAEHGYMAMIAKGARRQRRYGMASELVTMHHLDVHWLSGHADLVTLTEVARQQPLLPESRWLSGQQLISMANLLFRQHDMHGFEDLCGAFERLKISSHETTGLLAAQWYLLQQSGWVGSLEQCWQCHQSFAMNNNHPIWFSGQLACTDCRTGAGIAKNDLSAIAAAWQDSTTSLPASAMQLWQKMRDSVLYHIHHGG